MTDNDYIKAAVELADWFDVDEDNGNLIMYDSDDGQAVFVVDENTALRWFKDALAAQLRKQAQANPHIVFNITVIDSACFVEMLIYNPNGDEEAQPLRFVAHEIDEAMAFFKVTVDSGVLK